MAMRDFNDLEPDRLPTSEFARMVGEKPFAVVALEAPRAIQYRSGDPGRVSEATVRLLNGKGEPDGEPIHVAFNGVTLNNQIESLQQPDGTFPVPFSARLLADKNERGQAMWRFIGAKDRK
jgi:hypothetical protein